MEQGQRQVMGLSKKVSSSGWHSKRLDSIKDWYKQRVSLKLAKESKGKIFWTGSDVFVYKINGILLGTLFIFLGISW